MRKISKPKTKTKTKTTKGTTLGVKKTTARKPGPPKLRVASVVRDSTPKPKPRKSVSPAIKRGGEPEASELLVRRAIALALDKKAYVPVVLDVRGLAAYTDFVGIVSGRSERQVEAIADAVAEGLRHQGKRPLGVEIGSPQRTWALLDYGDFVLHVFFHPTRDFYDLESMLQEAPRLPIEVPAEQRHVPEAYDYDA